MTDKPALPSTGGSYTVHPDTGDLTQMEAPTADHPEGNRPRPAADTIDSGAPQAKKGAK